MKTKEITVYSLQDLEGRARERALDNLRENQFSDSSWYESVIDDAVRIAKLFGLDLESRSWTNSYGFKGKSPSVYFDTDRGRFCSFEGSYQYKKGALKAVKMECPKDEKLHHLVKDLQDVQKVNFYQLRASTSHGRECLRVSVERYDDKELTDGAEDAVTEALDDFGYRILNNLDKEIDYLSSDEYLGETAEANEYEFDESGGMI
jgi:hypothetical protein